MIILAKRLKELRSSCGWTQEWVADQLNISIGALSGYERGYRKPDATMLAMLAEIYNTSVDYLLGRTEDKRPRSQVVKMDYSVLFNQKDKGQAYALAADLRSRCDLSDETFLKIIDEIAEHYKSDKKGGAEAAHGPKEPGTGIFSVEIEELGDDK